MTDRSADESTEEIPPGQELPPDYLAPVGPEDDEGFVGIETEPVPGGTSEREEVEDAGT